MTEDTYDALNAEDDWLLALAHRTLSQAHLCDAIRTRAAERRAEFDAEKAEELKAAPLQESLRAQWNAPLAADQEPGHFHPEDQTADTVPHAGPDPSQPVEDPAGI
jgi:hypothetical protein